MKQKRAVPAVLLGLLVSLILVCPVYAGHWMPVEDVWYYLNEDGTLAVGWTWIDGNHDGTSECYYFDQDGRMYRDTVTPDNYTVDENGAWTENGEVRTRSSLSAEAIAEEAEALAEEVEAIAEEAEAVITALAEDEKTAEQAEKAVHIVTSFVHAGAEHAGKAAVEAVSAAVQQLAGSGDTAGEAETAAEAGPGRAAEAGPGQAADCADTACTDPDAEAQTADSSADTAQGRPDIVAFARQFVMKLPYVYGGTSLTTGADCSGFTKAVFSQFGITLPRTSREQLAAAPLKISAENALPGDLIFYGNPVYHVGIYEGNGRIVHETNSRRGWTGEDGWTAEGSITGIARYW